MPRLLLGQCGEAPDAIHAQHGGYVAWFERLFAGWPELEFDVVDMRDARDVPSTQYDGVVITGSKASLTTPEPWMEIAVELVRACAETRTPLLGVCFGHQLIASAFGAAVVPGPVERGTISIRRREDQDPLFANVPPTFLAPSMHEDEVAFETVAFGNGLRVLASSNQVPVQALAAGPFIRGVQFHPEFAEATVRSYLKHYEMPVNSEPCPHMPTIADNWLRGWVL